ncbi:MAG: patatin-like phospholipase family protein [Bacteroidales bacterium]
MYRRVGLYITLFLLVVNSLSARESVGLVLSGGGAKGIAHIGVIRALEENNIPIDYVTGTSMGAIVGGLYASGYTPDEMMALIKSKDFASWSSGVIDENKLFYFERKSPTPTMLELNFRLSDSLKIEPDIMPKSLVNPIPMNMALVELFAPYTLQSKSNFDNLFIPFRCVAADIFNKRKVVYSSGSFGDAIRASMSVPIIYQPIIIDDRLVVDGGIYDNFPIDVMRQDFNPDIIIGVDVVYTEKVSSDEDLINQLSAIVFQDQNPELTDGEGIKLSICLDNIGLLDFHRATEVHNVGYEFANEMIDSIKGIVPSRVSADKLAIKRIRYKNSVPKVTFDTISIEADKPKHIPYINSMIYSQVHDSVMTMGALDRGYYRAVSTNKIKNLLPVVSYNPEDDKLDLLLKTDIKDNLSLGLGAYITSTSNSMLFASAGYNTLNFNSLSASVSGWVGQAYYAGMIDSKITLLGKSIPSYLNFQGVLSTRNFYQGDWLFYDDATTSVITKVDNYIRIRYGWPLTQHGRFDLGVGYGYLRDEFYEDNVATAHIEQDYATYSLGQFYACLDFNRLNNNTFPTRGANLTVTAMGVYGDMEFNPYGASRVDDVQTSGWLQAELNMAKYFDIAENLTLGARADILFSTRELFGDYTAAIIQAPAFAPTIATQSYFNTGFRANAFTAVGVIPSWQILSSLSLRGDFYLYMPVRKIMCDTQMNPYYGNWFGDAEFIGEINLIYDLKFATINTYVNYLSYPALNWNFGIGLGFYLEAPKFLR